MPDLLRLTTPAEEFLRQAEGFYDAWPWWAVVGYIAVVALGVLALNAWLSRRRGG